MYMVYIYKCILILKKIIKFVFKNGLNILIENAIFLYTQTKRKCIRIRPCNKIVLHYKRLIGL